MTCKQMVPTVGAFILILAGTFQHHFRSYHAQSGIVLLDQSGSRGQKSPKGDRESTLALTESIP